MATPKTKVVCIGASSLHLPRLLQLGACLARSPWIPDMFLAAAEEYPCYAKNHQNLLPIPPSFVCFLSMSRSISMRGRSRQNIAEELRETKQRGVEQIIADQSFSPPYGWSFKLTERWTQWIGASSLIVEEASSPKHLSADCEQLKSVLVMHILKLLIE